MTWHAQAKCPQVCLRLGHFHFCGGRLVEDMVTTAAHCVVNLEQQVSLASSLALEPLAAKFPSGHGELTGPGDEVQPICLSHKGEDFQAECVASGWGLRRLRGNCLQLRRCLLIGNSNCKEQKPRGYKVRTLPFAKQSRAVRTDADQVPIEDEKKANVNPVGMSSQPLAESDQVTVTLASDGSNTGCGFELTFVALHKNSEPGLGCGSVARLVKIDTVNYPGLYPKNTKCHWLIEVPAEYVEKLELEDSAVDLSLCCIHDTVTVYADEENQLGTCDLPPLDAQQLFKHDSGAEEACPHCWPWHVALKLPGDYQCDGTGGTCESNKPLHWTVTVGNHDRALRESTEQMKTKDRQLQQTQVPVLENIHERNYYFSTPGGITARMLCASSVSVGSQDSCQTIYGIISWAVGCANPKKSGVSSGVRIFLDWRGWPMKECASEAESEELRGFISAPSSSGYVGSTECSWILRLSLKGMAKIIVKHLSITSALNCQEEFLGIYEESQGRKVLEPESNRSCYPWRIVAPLIIIWLEVLDFWTERNLSNSHDQLMVYEGYGLTKELIECSGFALIPVGTTEIISPSYPGIYPDMLNRTRTIYSTSGNKLKAALKDFVPEDARDCIWDHLMAKLPSTAGCFLTLFKTHESVGHRGFKILLEELDQQPTLKHVFVFLGQCSDRTVLGKKYLLPHVKDDNPMLVKAVLTHYGFFSFQK
ncbi:LOW QUALITY PROTEIN: ovochymase-1 [Rhynochetos jubatus]